MTQAHSQVAENSTRRQSTGWFEIMIGYVLLIGVLVSVSLLIVGTIWRLATTGTLQFHFHIQAMNLYDYVVSSIRSVVARELSPRIIIDLGISVLLLTPYTRVVA